MRHYLDQYVRLAAENFEKELTRVAQFDEEAQRINADKKLHSLLRKIKKGDISLPAEVFNEFSEKFLPDSKYSEWGSKLYFAKNEKKLFAASAALAYVLENFGNDIKFAEHCHFINFNFPDGWPNDPERFAETLRLTEQEQNQQDKQKPLSLIQRLKQWLT